MLEHGQSLRAVVGRPGCHVARDAGQGVLGLEEREETLSTRAVSGESSPPPATISAGVPMWSNTGFMNGECSAANGVRSCPSTGGGQQHPDLDTGIGPIHRLTGSRVDHAQPEQVSGRLTPERVAGHGDAVAIHPPGQTGPDHGLDRCVWARLRDPSRSGNASSVTHEPMIAPWRSTCQNTRVVEPRALWSRGRATRRVIPPAARPERPGRFLRLVSPLRRTRRRLPDSADPARSDQG